MKKVSVLSGGLDSTILTYWLVQEYGAENVLALTYNYGQRHSIEIEKAKISCKKLGIAHQIIDISFLGEIIKDVSALSGAKNIAVPTIKQVLGDPQPPTYVPYRNMILNALAFSFAESNKCDAVYTGIQNTDFYSYWDCSPEFIEAMNGVSILNRQHGIELRAPFVGLTKAEEIRKGILMNVPFEDTWTCYSGSENGIACFSCPSCAERVQNFAKAGIKDPVPYTQEIKWDELIAKLKE